MAKLWSAVTSYASDDIGFPLRRAWQTSRNRHSVRESDAWHGSDRPPAITVVELLHVRQDDDRVSLDEAEKILIRAVTKCSPLSPLDVVTFALLASTSYG
jgi:hypothetical protein